MNDNTTPATAAPAPTAPPKPMIMPTKQQALKWIEAVKETTQENDYLHQHLLFAEQRNDALTDKYRQASSQLFQVQHELHVANSKLDLAAFDVENARRDHSKTVFQLAMVTREKDSTLELLAQMHKRIQLLEHEKEVMAEALDDRKEEIRALKEENSSLKRANAASGEEIRRLVQPVSRSIDFDAHDVRVKRHRQEVIDLDEVAPTQVPDSPLSRGFWLTFQEEPPVVPNYGLPRPKF